MHSRAKMKSKLAPTKPATHYVAVILDLDIPRANDGVVHSKLNCELSRVFLIVC
jgi:hypothetical protein